MKKSLLVLLVLVLIIPTFLWPAWAQEITLTETEPPREFNYNRALQDYLYQFDQYRQAYKDYQVAKSQYQTYQTLTAETIALEQTIKMLQVRDEVIATYLTALRLRLAEKTKVGSSRLNALYLQLDEEIIWFREHKENLTSAGSIPDLLSLSKQTEDRYKNTEILIYHSLVEIFLYQEGLIHSQIFFVISELEAKINVIRESGDKDVGRIERWLLEAKNRKVRSDEKLTEAQSLEISRRSDSNLRRQNYNRIIYLLEQSHQYLKETNQSLSEIIREIKRGD